MKELENCPRDNKPKFDQTGKMLEYFSLSGKTNNISKCLTHCIKGQQMYTIAILRCFIGRTSNNTG